MQKQLKFTVMDEEYKQKESIYVANTTPKQTEMEVNFCDVEQLFGEKIKKACRDSLTKAKEYTGSLGVIVAKDEKEDKFYRVYSMFPDKGEVILEKFDNFPDFWGVFANPVFRVIVKF